MKLPFSSQNVYSIPKNMDAKAAQTNSIAREPFQTQNKKNIEAKISNFSNIIMNEISELKISKQGNIKEPLSG